ncbi:MAG TPA: hypothetical protein VNL77_04225 [Roseiflexaceae bacterium]|nr:hypothetical protein [Roseiflexaceae bacterium]
MGAHELAELEREVESLDAATARRVARLVLECRASLRDALAAVRMADAMADPIPYDRAPTHRLRLAHLLPGWRHGHARPR